MLTRKCSSCGVGVGVCRVCARACPRLCAPSAPPCSLGVRALAQVWAVIHKMRPDEGYAIKVSKREFRSRAERDEYLREVRLANDMPALEALLGKIAHG